VPIEVLLTVILPIVYPLFGVIVKVLLDPEATLTLPDGEIVPPAPAEAVIVNTW
jgi:hypothetical protein